MQEALSSDQPLWGFWDSIHDRSGSALTMEFIALANHLLLIEEAFDLDIGHAETEALI